MSLVHYGFAREEALWMPIPELQDYVQLINEQVEEENNEIANSNASSEKEKPKMLGDVFRGTIQ